jgi:peptidoglycan/xylan/chitin deacetylase (PgdA/CDA1 family)
MHQAADALYGSGTLPAKPVVITFDDGYTDQLKAFEALRQHNMKATFYIITGGEASKWCIGAARRYDQGYGCGDAYLTWDQVRILDTSGIIEIGSHTVDHLNLAAQSYAVQRFQIFQGKAELEAQLGHAVSSFAYPYGGYNSTSISLVREAGFTSAVTTLPGTFQSKDRIFTLYRVRLATALP